MFVRFAYRFSGFPKRGKKQPKSARPPSGAPFWPNFFVGGEGAFRSFPSKITGSMSGKGEGGGEGGPPKNQKKPIFPPNFVFGGQLARRPALAGKKEAEQIAALLPGHRGPGGTCRPTALSGRETLLPRLDSGRGHSKKGRRKRPPFLSGSPHCRFFNLGGGGKWEGAGKKYFSTTGRAPMETRAVCKSPQSPFSAFSRAELSLVT